MALQHDKKNSLKVKPSFVPDHTSEHSSRLNTHSLLDASVKRKKQIITHLSKCEKMWLRFSGLTQERFHDSGERLGWTRSSFLPTYTVTGTNHSWSIRHECRIIWLNWMFHTTRSTQTGTWIKVSSPVPVSVRGKLKYILGWSNKYRNAPNKLPPDRFYTIHFRLQA